jgi:subtilisin family serine protease
MRTRPITIVLSLSLAITLVEWSAAAQPSRLPVRPDAGPHERAVISKVPMGTRAASAVPGEIVVTWRRGARPAERRALASRLGARTLGGTSPVAVDVVRVPAGRSVAAAIGTLSRSPLVLHAEPNRIATIAGIPTDPLFGQQWALHNTAQVHEIVDVGLPGSTSRGKANADVNAPQAWDAQSVHSPVTVAVVDTGVDLAHPDLDGALWVNPVEQAGVPGIDDDGNGFVDDVHGYDFGNGDGNPTPTNGLTNSHGTHVAGIIAAEQGDGFGIAGVCPDCRIMALRLGPANALSLGAEVQAINYAVDNGADVINLSLGSPVWSPSERAAIDRAGRNGVLVVISAGNSSSDNDTQFYASDTAHFVAAQAPSYPATYTMRNILAVAASNDRDQYGYASDCRNRVPLWRCGFTSWGHDSVDVAAPGVDIVSTVKQGEGPGSHPNHAVFDGTSMAAPMVAGIAGLVLSEHPGFSPVNVKNAIMNSAASPASLKLYDSWADEVDLPKRALAGRFTRTQGRVNALAALDGSIANATPRTDGNIDGARSIATRRSGAVTWPADVNDVFRKRLTRGTRYEVELNGPRGRDLDLWVWRPGTKEIFQFTSGCFRPRGACPALQAASVRLSADERVVFRAPKTGVFFVQVNGWYSGGHYTLRIRRR